MSGGSNPFHDGRNTAWELVVWRSDHERVVIAELDRGAIARVRDHFDRGDDAWMYDVYPVPADVLPRIAELVPGVRLDPAVEYYVEAHQDLAP